MSDSSLLHALAGAGAGCASLAITYPLYSRMVRQQVQEQKAATGVIVPAEPFREQLRVLFSRAGLEQQFAGLSAALYAISIQSAVFYYFFQLFKNIHSVSTSPLGNILVSTEAGIATVMLTNPLWVINSRQITQKGPIATKPVPAVGAATGDSEGTSSGKQGVAASPTVVSPSPSKDTITSESSFFHAFKLLVRDEGLAGVYTGIGPALALVSSPALQFYSYEYLKHLVQKYRRTLALSSLDFFLLGMVSKILATLATYPIQTVKSQLQKTNSPYARSGWLAGSWECTRDMATSKDGVASLYRGLQAKILQTGLTAGFLFIFRERSVAILTKLVELYTRGRMRIAK